MRHLTLPPSESAQLSISEQLLRRNVKRFRGGLVCKAHRLVYPSTLGWRVIKKKKEGVEEGQRDHDEHEALGVPPKRIGEDARQHRVPVRHVLVLGGQRHHDIVQRRQRLVDPDRLLACTGCRV